MAYEISVGLEQLTINLGECVLITEPDGQIHEPGERGFFFRDTRLLSRWTASVNGLGWRPVSSAATAHFAAQAVLINPELPTDGAPVPAGSVSLTVSRLLSLGGIRETLTLRNHNRVPVRLRLAIRLECDFADIFDVKSHRLVQRGDTVSRWFEPEGRLETVHSNATFRRGISVEPAADRPRPVLRDGKLDFAAEVAPQGGWSTELLYRVIDGNTLLDASDASFSDRADARQSRALAEWRAQAMRLHTPHIALQQLFDQSRDDLAALRLPIEGTDMRSFVPAAGIPWFAALFGRDSILAAIQAVAVYPSFACGALSVLARYQADGFDDDRDMQPGKIPHELRRGELAELGLVPYRPYYGTADATPLYLVLLHHAWRFTGDRGLIEQHLDTAERCLDWIDRFGDLDGDGFQEYRRLAPDGAENQGWKDSGNAIVQENGDQVAAPKALCELQGYVFDAWTRMAEIFDALGRPADAERLRNKADTMFARFNESFWDDDARCYALCLGPDKRRVMSVASNMGHLLWSGIVPPDRAALVAERLMRDDMWSGWGVRTLSAAHPAYNPHDYQLGAVWPHDNGFIALGLKRYGFHAEAARIAGGLIDAGARFFLHRLPEVFAGTSRGDTPFPVQYLGASVPQAWAAGSVFCLIRALVGADIDAAAGAVFADPFLPDWLPELCILNLQVGERTVDLRVWREDGETRMALLRGDGVALRRRGLQLARPSAAGTGDPAAAEEPRGSGR